MVTQLRLKIALDELRMLMMGSQILFGFQLRAGFESRADTFDRAERALLATSTVLMAVTIGILIAGPSYHRIVARGAADDRVLRMVTAIASAALPPFAISLGCGFALVVRRPLGPALSWAAGGAMLFLALSLWYLLPIGIRVLKEGRMAKAKHEHVPLPTRIDQMLTEARVILPGAQAVLGFQLIALLTDPFDRMPSELQILHILSMLAVGLAVILLMAPAALHRLGYGGDAKLDMLRLGAVVVTIALVPLGLGIAGDVCVAVAKVLGHRLAGYASGSGMLLVLVVLWFGWPIALRLRRRDDERP